MNCLRSWLDVGNFDVSTNCLSFSHIREEVKIPPLHLVTFCKSRLVRFSSVTPLPHVKLKVTPGDNIQLLFPIFYKPQATFVKHLHTLAY